MWFAAANAIASLMAWPLGAWLLGDSGFRHRAASAPACLLTVRLLPAAASSVFVLAVFLPAHWRFEPAESDESFGLVLGGLAAIGLVAGARRSAWRAGQCGPRRSPLRSSDAARGAIASQAVGLSSFELGGLPGVSLAGIWRPRILIGSEALSALTPAELDVAISHEVAHRRSQDNLKRFLLYLRAGPLRLDAQWPASSKSGGRPRPNARPTRQQ